MRRASLTALHRFQDRLEQVSSKAAVLRQKSRLDVDAVIKPGLALVRKNMGRSRKGRSEDRVTDVHKEAERLAHVELHLD